MKANNKSNHLLTQRKLQNNKMLQLQDRQKMLRKMMSSRILKNTNHQLSLTIFSFFTFLFVGSFGVVWSWFGIVWDLLGLFASDSEVSERRER